MVYAGLILLYLNIYAVPPLTLGIMREGGLSHAQAGLLMTVFVLAYCVGNLAAGALSDKFGAVPVMAAGLAAGFVSSFILASGLPFWLLVASRLLTGFAAAAMTSPCQLYLTLSQAPERRTMAISLQLVALTMGSAMAFLITPLLAARVPWRMVLAGYGGLGLALLLPFLRLVGNIRPQEPKAAPAPPQAGARRRDLRALALISAILFVSIFQLGGTLTWLPPWLQERAGFDPLRTGLLSMTFSLVGIPSAISGALVAGRLGGGDKAAAVRLSLIGTVISASTLLLVWLEDAAMFLPILLVVSAARWGSFMFMGSLLGLVPRLAAGLPAGLLIGAVNAVGSSGGMFSSFAGGLIIQATGQYRLLWTFFGAALAFSAAVLHPLALRALRAREAA